MNGIHQTKEGIWVLDNDSHISKWIEEKGSLQHDYQSMPVMLDLMNEGDCVIDIGACIGDTAIPFADKVGPTGHVLAFEPNPLAFECLKRNAANYPNITCIQSAVGDYIGTTGMNLLDNAGASFVTKGDGFPMTILDGMDMNIPHLIKIDAEGYELNVLDGAENTIMTARPIIIMEVNEGALRRHGVGPAEVFTWLTAHGYSYESILPGEIGSQYDIIARP